MKYSRTRKICLAGALVCGVAAVLIGAYLFALNAGFEVSFPGFGFLVACILFGYFASSAGYDQFLWLGLLKSKSFLCMLSLNATCVSVFCLVLTLSSTSHRQSDWLLLPLLSLSTLAAAVCLRRALGVRAFGWHSLVYSLPVGLLSIGPISYLLFPPAADPVGGAGIGAGILVAWMIPFIIVAIPMWIAAACFERWQISWHFLIVFLCLPGTAAISLFFAGIAR